MMNLTLPITIIKQPTKPVRTRTRRRAAVAVENIFLPDADELLASVLPKIDGSGLTQGEVFRLNRAENTARAAYSADLPDAEMTEVFRVGTAARKDALRAVLRDRPAAIDDRDIITVINNDPAIIPGADPLMTPEELEILVELNATNPAGAVEAELERFPAFTTWPRWTGDFYWADTPIVEPEPRLTLAELVDVEAERLRSHGLAAYDLMADHLRDLARIVRTVDASRADQVWERVSVLDRDFTESAAAWELPEPERNSAGQWA